MPLFLHILALLALSACGTLARQQTGPWTLHFKGDCAGRESEPIQVTRLDAAQLHFDDFSLHRDAADLYRGSANFIAPMPADGRDIIYTVSYSLRRETDSKLSGIQSITEGGGHSLPCPVELIRDARP